MGSNSVRSVNGLSKGISFHWSNSAKAMRILFERVSECAMKGPSTRRFSIAANTRKLDVDNRFPLKKYYRAADNLLKQAHIYREEKNLIELYVLLLRFSSLVGETIPQHRDYKLFPGKAVYTQKFTHVLLELENLKPEVQRHVDILNKQIADADTTKQEHGIEWPPISRDPSYANGGRERNELVPHKFQNSSSNIAEQLNNFSLKFPPPNKDTLSRHSFLGPDGLRAHWKPLVAHARVEYPNYSDVSSDAASLDQNWSKMLSNEAASDATSVTVLEAEPTSQKEMEAVALVKHSQPNLIKQPPPPPVAAPVQDLSVMAELMQLYKPEDPLPSSVDAVDPCPLPISAALTKDLETSDGPKQLHISIKMMDEFMRLAGQNTRNNIETCAVLAGSFKNATFNVTALIIPKQQATANTCHTENEEEIFEWQDKEGLFQLGWIHTHPTQSCFMSSVDLHTHYSYQVMLPEAIAIVMAPTDCRRKYGIFRLSDPGGVKTIQKCQLRGFHAHDPPLDGSQIYEPCAHVLLSTDLKFQVVDLR
ncbi:hypothetical protein GOP47_0008086 [Adiantum capillus-veneris]|uniref:MPN domain-containing protein n=1 Tax=Adiantum capillus-veneris TaxID=13818 RepID=A0A9D4UXT3_ADICA|nr:hypothetical protein GOP47_0008086 [Adiantum capillus-veneris]